MIECPACRKLSTATKIYKFFRWHLHDVEYKRVYAKPCTSCGHLILIERPN